MSHFTVGVFTIDGQKTVEELLAPFQENSCGPCPMEYMEFFDKEDEEKENYESKFIEVVELFNGEVVLACQHDCEPGERVELWPFKDYYPTFEDYMRDYCGYDERDPIRKRYGYWENPNAKWDWYSVGGRWEGQLLSMKTGEYMDSLPCGEIDFDKMRETDSLSLCPYNEASSKSFYTEEFFKEKYPDEETYVRMMTTFSTYAVITPDGEWHAPAEMGWFGMDDGDETTRRKFHDEYKEKFIDPGIKNGWTLTIVDCHI